MSTETTSAEATREENSIFTQMAFTADRVEVRRLLPNRKFKYMGRIPRDQVEMEPGVVAQRYGGGKYRLQIIRPGNKYGRSIEMTYCVIAYGPPRDDDSGA